MQLFMSLFDESKQQYQAQFPFKLDYHAQKGRFKIIHQGLMIPDLPAPLHYFSFLSMIGQPNVPVLRNNSVIKTTPIDTATVISSISPHMVGHLNAYSIRENCQFQHDDFRFGQKEQLIGEFPTFQLTRNDSELSVDLKIRLQPVISHFTKFKLGLFDHWSLMCLCTGEINYKGQRYYINQRGSFEYARAINFPYLPLCLFTYQVINLKNKRQLLLVQVRNNFNQIMQSRIYLRDLNALSSEMYDENVQFKIHRVYPKVKTPNGQEMYLPREFEWCYQDGKRKISIYAESRGDFKFGLAAGYVGSFRYNVKIDGVEEQGESGYCEYIDCRALKFQEKTEIEKNIEKMTNTVPCKLKK